jgi:4-amino-4-deoxychorismate mutase
MTELDNLRQEIDTIDEVVVAQLARRFAVVRKVAAYKGKHGIPAVLPERIDVVKSRCAALAATQDLDPELVRALYDLIIKAACRLEEEIIEADAA